MLKDELYKGIRIDGNGYAVGRLEYEYNGRETWIDGWQVYPHTVKKVDKNEMK